MEVIKIIGIALASLLGLALAIGGVVFWRGWFYAARHGGEMARTIARREELLRENVALLEKINKMNINNKKEENDE